MTTCHPRAARGELSLGPVCVLKAWGPGTVGEVPQCCRMLNCEDMDLGVPEWGGDLVGGRKGRLGDAPQQTHFQVTTGLCCSQEKRTFSQSHLADFPEAIIRAHLMSEQI